MRDIKNPLFCSKPDWKVIKRLTQIGLPIALALFFEITLFAVVALLISPLGIVDIAGRQIAINYSSLIFVLPLSLAVSVTIRVDFYLGQGATDNAQVAADTGIVIGIGMANDWLYHWPDLRCGADDVAYTLVTASACGTDFTR